MTLKILFNKRRQNNIAGDVSLMASGAVTDAVKDTQRHIKIHTYSVKRRSNDFNTCHSYETQTRKLVNANC